MRNFNQAEEAQRWIIVSMRRHAHTHTTPGRPVRAVKPGWRRTAPTQSFTGWEWGSTSNSAIHSITKPINVRVSSTLAKLASSVHWQSGKQRTTQIQAPPHVPPTQPPCHTSHNNCLAWRDDPLEPSQSDRRQEYAQHSYCCCCCTATATPPGTLSRVALPANKPAAHTHQQA